MSSKPESTQIAQYETNPNKIIHLYQAIIEDNPEQPLWFYSQFGELFIQQGEIDRGIEILEQAISLYPDQPGGYIALGYAFSQKGDRENSLKNYRISVSCDPNPPEWIKRLLEQDKTDIVELEGIHLFINSDAISEYLQNVIRLGGYETEEIKILKKIIEPTDKIIELGGGIGFLSIYAKKQFPQLQISSYEANPNLIEIIRKNQQLNDCEFPIYNVILDGEEEGEVEFFLTEDFWASSTIQPPIESAAIQVKTQNINQAIESQNANFLIIDIEGGEANLIPKINLNNIRKILIEIHPQVIGNEGFSRVFLSLLSNGFLYDCHNSIGPVYYFYKEN
ncbi:FkbM family methyltransferase [Capilliphycus salinus ALCB114379]|uniref:FkbM family methyltransferase n=1 Tax=Capilliphycus salinus TaxID=2768948 RepID=UPI0039A43079